MLRRPRKVHCTLKGYVYIIIIIIIMAEMAVV